jgi:hypothetical protein
MNGLCHDHSDRCFKGHAVMPMRPFLMFHHLRGAVIQDDISLCGTCVPSQRDGQVDKSQGCKEHKMEGLNSCVIVPFLFCVLCVALHVLARLARSRLLRLSTPHFCASMAPSLSAPSCSQGVRVPERQYQKHSLPSPHMLWPKSPCVE